MKQLTKYNRVAGYFNKLYDMLNADFFGGEMERPVITIQSTPKAYGHFSLYNAWTVSGEGVPEINIGAGTLQRPIEQVVATLVHEMTHQYNYIRGVQDCSRGATYHNKEFKKSAEARGLIVERSEKSGWSITSCSDELLEWILDNELEDIQLNRNEFGVYMIGGKGGGTDKPTSKGRSSYRKHTCPTCGLTARTTKDASLVCGDCEVDMEQGA